MKKKIIFILLTTVCASCMEIYSQEPCKVLKQEIADKYTGKCKNGLAHGKGVAEGKDKYEGNFKNGLPHGKGKYTWSTGEVYDGNWEKGIKNGVGKYFYKINDVDSLRYGIWKDDVFFKKIIPPQYKVLKSISVSRYTVHCSGNGNNVLFSFMLNGSNNSSLSELFFFNSSGSIVNRGSKLGFDNVEFPFKCKVSYRSQNSLKTSSYEVVFEIEINEAGNWEVVLINT